MQAIATGFERVHAPPRYVSTKRIPGILRALRDALDRLVPRPGGAAPDRELPAEWFKYPPV